MDGWMDGWIDGWMDVDGRMDRRLVVDPASPNRVACERVV